MAGERILFAFRSPQVAMRLCNEFISKPSVHRIVAVIDPTVDRDMTNWIGQADILLIGLEEACWLLSHNEPEFEALCEPLRVVVLVEEENFLGIESLHGRDLGLLIHSKDNPLSPDRVELAISHYIVSSPGLLSRLLKNRPRLQIAETLSPDERSILKHLAAGHSNRRISELTSLREARVKSIVCGLMHKLHLKNRAMLAVFAAENDLSGDGNGDKSV